MRTPCTRIAAAVTLLAAPAVAGDLDPTFGTGGAVQIDLGASSVAAKAVVLQPDGKLVAAGNADGKIVLVRVDSGGVPDPTFGGGDGIAVGPDGGCDDLVLQPDGKLVTAGGNFKLVRFLPDGTLDPGFGSGGIATAPLSNGFCNALARQSDGGLVALGDCCAGIFSAPDMKAQRFLSDGTQDMSFGSGGVVTLGGTGGRDLAVQDDDQVVAAGTDGRATGGSWEVARFTTSGGTTFQFGYSWGAKFDEATAVGIQSDGRIVVAGNTEDSSGHDTGQPVLRLTAAGNLDTTFGSGGTVHNLDAGPARDLVVLPDQRFVVAGGGGYQLTRYLANGTVDTGFGDAGSVTAPLSGGAEAVLVQADGKLVAVGTSDGAFTLVRFDPGASTPTVTSYGCGVNPTGSLSVLAGAPAIGTSIDLGIDDPTGAQVPGALPILALAVAPDPGHPCGTLLPGWGMAGPAATGELLLDPGAMLAQLFTGPPWAGPGTPAPISIALPSELALIGKSVFAQGVLYDGGVPDWGLTTGLELVIGS